MSSPDDRPSPSARIPASGAPPTVHDVARLAKVSPMTVSRALNGSKHVAVGTRERVARAAEALGYVRNENARSLRPGQRTRLLGVIITHIDNPYYAGVLLGIEELAGHTGRRVVVGISHGDPAVERRLVDDFVGRQVEGLIIVPTGAATEHLGTAGRGGLPLVLASRGVPELDVDTVLVDDVQGARRGTQLLFDNGCSRIAFLGNVESVTTAERRYEGFYLAHRKAGVPIDEGLIVRRDLDAHAAEQQVAQMVGQVSGADGYFAANNRIAVGVVRALLRRRQQHPRQPVTPVVSFDDFDFADFLDYPIHVVDHDPRELGRTAARLLLERLDGRLDRGPLVVSLPTTVRPWAGN